MDNPVIQTDIAEVLKKLDSRLDKIDERLNRIEIGQSEIRGDLKAMDERLSGQIKAVDERLSGQIKAVNVQLEQLDKRVGNQEFTQYFLNKCLYRSRRIANR